MECEELQLQYVPWDCGLPILLIHQMYFLLFQSHLSLHGLLTGSAIK